MIIIALLTFNTGKPHQTFYRHGGGTSAISYTRRRHPSVWEIDSLRIVESGICGSAPAMTVKRWRYCSKSRVLFILVLAKFSQHAEGGFRMQEGDAQAFGTQARGLVDEADA